MRAAFCETAKAAKSEHFATLLKHCIEDDEKFAARLAAREKEAQEREQREREEYERKQKDIQEFQRLKKEKLQEHGKKEVEEVEEDEVLDEEDNEEEEEDGEEVKKNRKKKIPALTISSADPDAIVDEEDRDSSGSGSSSSDDSNGEKSKKRLRIRSSIDELKKEKDGDEESIDLKERKIRSRKTSTKIGDEVEGDNPPPAEPGGSTSSRKPKVTRTRKRTIGGHEEHFSPALTPPGEQPNKDGKTSPRDSLVVAGHRYDETPPEASDTTITTTTSSAPQQEPPAATNKEVLTIGIEEEVQGMEKVANGEELSKPTDEPQQVQTAAPEDTQVHHVMIGGEEESQAARSGAELEGQEK